VDGLADSDLLWVDVDSRKEAVAEVARLFPVDFESMSVAATSRPFIHDFGESFVLGVLPFPPSMAKPESEALICAVGHNWLVTVHDTSTIWTTCTPRSTTSRRASCATAPLRRLRRATPCRRESVGATRGDRLQEQGGPSPRGARRRA
jgi:hypothetical protein